MNYSKLSTDFLKKNANKLHELPVAFLNGNPNLVIATVTNSETEFMTRSNILNLETKTFLFEDWKKCLYTTSINILQVSNNTYTELLHIDGTIGKYKYHQVQIFNDIIKVRFYNSPKYTLIDHNENIIIDNLDVISNITAAGFTGMTDNVFTIYNLKGEVLHTANYTDYGTVSTYNTSYFIFHNRSNRRVDLYDRDYNAISKNEFTYINSFNEYLMVENGAHQKNLFDPITKKLICSTWFNTIFPIDSNTNLILVYTDGYNIYDIKTNKFLFKKSYTGIKVHGEFFIVNDNGNCNIKTYNDVDILDKPVYAITSVYYNLNAFELFNSPDALNKHISTKIKITNGTVEIIL